MITLRFAGTSPDTTLRLEELLKQLEAVRKALKETQRILKGPEVHYRVVGISRSSPYEIRLEADAASSERRQVALLERTFPHAAKEIQEGQRRPANFDGPALHAYQEMTANLETTISPMEIETTVDEGGGTAETHVVSVTNQLAKRVGVILGPKSFVLGSLVGRLERLNIHGGQNVFVVYPLTGPAHGISCRFPREMLSHVTEGVDRYVEVVGLLVHNEVDYFPEEVRVKTMTVFPEEKDFPDISALRGIAPDATGGLSTEDFLRGLRGEAE
jgi:hypothetical protein